MNNELKILKDLEKVYESAKQDNYTKEMLRRIRERLKEVKEK